MTGVTFAASAATAALDALVQALLTRSHEVIQERRFACCCAPVEFFTRR